MNRIKFCLLLFITGLCIITTPIFQANAVDATGAFGTITWTITDETLEVKCNDIYLDSIYQNNMCTIYGDIFSSKTYTTDNVFSDENEPLWQYIMDHPTYCLELNLQELSVSISGDCSLHDLKELIVGDQVKCLRNNSLTGFKKLTEITILSKDVDISDSGIGFIFEGKKLENVTIKGYKNSTAETYANENGFTFIALDEQPTTTTTTEPIITTTTASTTIVSTDEIKTESTTDTTTISGTVTTDGITTVVVTETETDSKPTTATTTKTDTEQTTATTTITTETDTEPTTMLTTTDTPGNITTESSTVTTVTTTGTDTTLPQTGYSKWYQVIARLAVCMTGIGGAMVIGFGKLKKKRK